MDNFFDWLITDTWGIVTLAAAAVVLLLLIIIPIVVVKKKRKKAKQKQIEQQQNDKNLIEKDNVRMTVTSEYRTEDGQAKISFNASDITVKQHEKVVASKLGPIKPGKYVVLSTSAGKDKMNIRKGAYIREFFHGEEMVLVEGEELTPTSSSIILR